MTEGLAIEIAKQMMQEQGVNDQYIYRYRHFQLAPLKELELKGHNELILLIRPDQQVLAFSKAGIYNVQDSSINEMQYIHRGVVTIVNQSKEQFIQVKILQVIPKLNTVRNGRV